MLQRYFLMKTLSHHKEESKCIVLTLISSVGLHLLPNGYILHHSAYEKGSKLPFLFGRRCRGPEYRRVAGTMRGR